MENFVLEHHGKNVYYKCLEMGNNVCYYYYVEGNPIAFGSLDHFGIARTKDATQFFKKEYNHLEIVQWIISKRNICNEPTCC